ncbi:TPA: ATP-binding protein, partial [Pasteurella multocida]|nr:ATP-binding protein [Pasteurella multocida]
NLMSSGHAFVLLTITQLVAKVEEKTLVLLDEPESHLHPPLLSAFIRTLSELLDNRNAIAIVATHSPVVLQEIPKSCIWKIVRTGIETKAYRLVTETFGENIGILTREVFGLEVEKSGFHKLL